MSMLDGKVILVTGGTGSFGQMFIKTVLENHKPEKLIVFSRDELKQSDMQNKFGPHPALRYFLGDIRDEKRLYRAFHGVDYVVHAAALKQVPTLEYNPLEAVKTNIMGAENIINAAIDQKVKKVIALSTDKAANPINLYGATKLCMEKLFIAGNSYSGAEDIRFSVVRYGNVVGSRGSVIPFFREKREGGVLPITDERMSRFWLTLEQGVAFVLKSLEMMQGGEIFIPKIPSMNIMDLAKAIAPECETKVVGIRPGEKLSEVMVTEEESTHAVEFKDMFAILPEHSFWTQSGFEYKEGKKVKEAFRYDSATNTQWLTVEDLRNLIGEKQAVGGKA